ncbi:D-alanyl-D-alanine carboxypeptidase (penicillin-binding protein 5/6) [Sedimentibacter acidaminivorans]|uniref:serine-type D-Ala-D-Ala carboxypeptidase n=1 Tax=Sedimentibacter acidaminivorans TaxID=913099 RepID=A0ABS4GBB6_9FIRM|nr:D-alanyl-D-alanine carboxypeptidase family protein [Sedimentibacter acidaminivorans]MBP1924967.1 D-alanyl-D-alanine carboxypeptidase (penicillin-binding protein 5/6) [Sedimentibacter acidaminivorans]
MIKKFLFCFIVFSMILLNLNEANAQPSILCRSAVLIDADTGTILAGKDANKKMYPASTTKIMTAILAIEMGNLSDVITVDEKTPFEIIGSHIALEPGEILTLKDLLYALMLPSANDAAAVIAKHYGGSTEEFAKLMNNKAKELGALNTHFANPHGLHDENHYTTATDLAIITKYAMQNETFRTIVGTKKYEIQPTNKKTETRYFTNLNKMLYCSTSSQIHIDGRWVSPLYDGTIGVKTGYTPEAGNCLVSYVEKNGTNLIVVAMNGVSLEMYEDAHNLFNYGFSDYKSTKLVSKNTFIQNLQIENGDSKTISAITESDFSTLVKKNSTKDIKSNVIINNITLPIKKNDIVGKLEFSIDGKTIGSVNLITPISVQSTLLDSPKKKFGIFNFVMILAFIILILIVIRTYNNIRIKINKRKRRKRFRADI